jgi:trehalose 6-phosphate phosphatase
VPAPATLAEALQPLLADPARTAILLDLDGTLAPIVRDPEAATVPEGVRQLVMRLPGRYGLVGVVSGRRAATARRILGLGTIPYAGNHGAELLVRGAAEAAVDPEAERWAGRVRAVADAVRADQLRAAGLLREDKGPIVALHWRGADDEQRAEGLAREIAESAREAGLVIHDGRRVLELRPPIPIGKDAAVRRLLATAPVDAALYVGDDRTDVDAFDGLRALVDKGALQTAVCVGVRSDETPAELIDAADALVDGIDGVRALLGALII